MRAAFLLMLFGCGVSCGGASSGAVRGESASAACLRRQHLTPSELAASPRANRELEVYSAKLAGTVAPDPAIYARLMRDTDAIRAMFPSLSLITYRSNGDDRTLMLGHDGGANPLRHGSSPAFEALGRRFGHRIRTDSQSWFLIEFDRAYDLERLRVYYQRIPELPEVSINFLTGDGPSLCVDREEDDDVWTYWVLDAGGDCPAGCTTLHVVAVRTRRSGSIERVAEARTDENGRGTPLAPDLIASMGRCHERERVRAERPTEICE